MSCSILYSFLLCCYVAHCYVVALLTIVFDLSHVVAANVGYSQFANLQSVIFQSAKFQSLLFPVLQMQLSQRMDLTAGRLYYFSRILLAAGRGIKIIYFTTIHVWRNIKIIQICIITPRSR